jgi:hypothetical protein
MAQGVVYAYEHNSILTSAAVTRDRAAVATALIDREPLWIQPGHDWVSRPDETPIAVKLRSLLPGETASLTDAEYDEVSRVFGYPSITATIPVDDRAFDTAGGQPQ